MHARPKLWVRFRVSRRMRGLGVACLLLVLALQLVHVAHVYSANWDEAHHLYDGYNIWTHRDYRLNAEVPPLVKLWAALPVLPMRVQPPPQLHYAQQKNAFLEGRAFVFGNGGDRLLFPARMMCMLFTLLLAFLIYAAGRRMFGALAGVAALFLFIFDPNVLAHGALVETDIASACFLFAAVFAFFRYVEHPSAPRLILAGLAAGCAMSAKYTGILIAPMLLLLACAEALRARSLGVLWKLLAACLGALVCAAIVIWAFYGFRYAPAPGGLALSPPLPAYIASLPNHGGAGALTLLARMHALPEAYLWGLAQTKHTEWEFTSYFFGKIYRHGPWEYFPFAFLIKSTLPLLVLLVLTPLLWTLSHLRRGRELTFLLLPAGIYFVVITSSHFDIGARHSLPVYPFLYVLVGATVALATRRNPLWAIAVALLLLWQLVTSVRVAPAYMAYGNEAFGGPLHVRNYLSDANVDWGQQLKAVRAYLEQNHVAADNCWFAYFPDGAVQPQDYGIQCQRLPTPSGLWWLDLPMHVPPVISGTVLISESDLDGVESGDGALNPYLGFRTLKPAAMIQDGVYVYRGTFAVPLASAWVDIRDADALAASGHAADALTLAKQAVQLAPNSARAQLAYAQALAANSRWPEAAQAFAAAQRDLAADRPDLEGDELQPQITAGLAQAAAHIRASAAQ